MYLRKIRIQNLKLLRDVKIDFMRDGKPRPFTVFVGENGTCKTSLLQAIALAASGADRANQIAEAGAYPDLRGPKAKTDIEADFSFGSDYHRDRVYPGPEEADLEFSSPPVIKSHVWTTAGFDLFRGGSVYDRPALNSRSKRIFDPLGDARGRNLGHWFIAGYGVGRTLPAPMSVTPEELASPSRDRLLSLFKVGRRIIGTGFADLLPPQRAEVFNSRLQELFVGHAILPHAKALTLRARGNVNNALERIRAHRLTLETKSGEFLEIPTLWLSQGYQATMAWVADLVGQVWWEADKQEIPADDMEGICLIDEIDLHLHPVWQVNLVSALKTAFPKIQFIATTHSPMVLPGLCEDEIIRLEQDKKGDVVRVFPKIAPALKTGTELYSDFFDINRLEPVELDDALFRYGGLANYAERSDEQDQEMQGLVVYLREKGIDPGYAPVPRASAAPKSSRAPRARASKAKPVKEKRKAASR